MIIKYINAHIIDKDSDYQGIVITDGDRIVYCGESDSNDYAVDEVVDVNNNILMPAFVDMHCHLRDPGYPQKETIETGMRAALKGGYATLCAMANTNPVCSTPELVEANHNKAKELGLCRLIQSASAGDDLEDKIPTDYERLSKVTKVITNDGKTIFSDEFMRNLLISSKKYGFIISTHCQPERKIVARDIELLKEVGGNLHVGHISTRETAQMIREALAQGYKITCEVTPHHLIGFDMDYRVNPPLRTYDDTVALVDAIKDGTVYCLATDHAPHTVEDKANGMAGISNIEYAMQVYLNVFYKNDISLNKFSELISYNPSKLLGIESGLIKEGYFADLVIVDANYISKIDSKEMISKSHNTPFDGYEVRGKVIKTVVGGKILYDN